jgi:hypothetical protein
MSSSICKDGHFHVSRRGAPDSMKKCIKTSSPGCQGLQIRSFVATKLLLKSEAGVTFKVTLGIRNHPSTAAQPEPHDASSALEFEADPRTRGKAASSATEASNVPAGFLRVRTIQ